MCGFAAVAAAVAIFLLVAALGDHLPPVFFERLPEEHELPSRGQPGSGQGLVHGGAVAPDEGGVPVGVEAVEAFL